MTDVLVLNFTYQVLNLTNFQRALRLIFAGKAEIVHRSPIDVASATAAFPLPSVIRMLYMVKRPPCIVSLTRANVLRRDKERCCYCGASNVALTLDHVVPRSRGGKSTWENLVTACVRCNEYKANRTPQEAKMTLRIVPRAPHGASWLRFSMNRLADVAYQYVIGA